MEAIYKEFGRQLREKRKHRRLTQQDVADRVGLTRTSITNIEQGRQHVALHQLLDLASAVGVEPHELLPVPAASAEHVLPQSLRRALGGSERDERAVAQVFNRAQNLVSRRAVGDSR